MAVESLSALQLDKMSFPQDCYDLSGRGECGNDVCLPPTHLGACDYGRLVDVYGPRLRLLSVHNSSKPESNKLCCRVRVNDLPPLAKLRILNSASAHSPIIKFFQGQDVLKDTMFQPTQAVQLVSQYVSSEPRWFVFFEAVLLRMRALGVHDIMQRRYARDMIQAAAPKHEVNQAKQIVILSKIPGVYQRWTDLLDFLYFTHREDVANYFELLDDEELPSWLDLPQRLRDARLSPFVRKSLFQRGLDLEE